MKPIKRHEALQQLSREHHFGLLFCWKLRQGMQHGVALDRMQKYADWFWKNNQIKHFELEEGKLFPILGLDHPKVVRAIDEHRQIEAYFKGGINNEQDLNELDKLLVAHIRFEERDLFNDIQQVANAEQLKLLEEHDHQAEAEDWTDEFWEKK